MAEFDDTHTSREDAGEIPSPEGGEVGESLAQLNQRYEQFDDGGEQFEEGEDSEPGYDDGEEYGEPDAAALTQFVDTRIEDAVNFRDQVRDRWDAINRLGEQYPQLQDPELAGQVRQVLEHQGLLPGDGIPPDPLAVEVAFKALAADRAHAAETHVDDLPADPGATLETAAGPGPPEQPALDPQEAAWMKAAIGDRSQHAF